MGLSIHSKSDKEYRWNYGALHQIRYMGYRALDGKASYSDWHRMYTGDNVDQSYVYAFAAFPNLYWHSDCEGTYTKRGKVGSYIENDPLLTGSSVGLLDELEKIKHELETYSDAEITDLDWQKFNDLYELVKDVVENYDGKLEFF